MPRARTCATNQAFVVGAVFAVLTAVAGVFCAAVHHADAARAAGRRAGHPLCVATGPRPAVCDARTGGHLLPARRGRHGDGAGGAGNLRRRASGAEPGSGIGWGPFPALGWNGLAIGAAAGYVVGGIIILGCLLWGRAGLRLRGRLLWPNLEMIRRLLRVGLPGGADVMSVIACHIWFISVVNRLGDEASAAHGVAVKIESLAFLPGSAFYVAASTLAGQYLGARDFRKASRSVLVCALMSAALLSAAGLLFFFGGGALSRIFLSDQQEHLVELVVPLLQIVSFGMPALALLNTFTGALRGSGDTALALGCHFVRFRAGADAPVVLAGPARGASIWADDSRIRPQPARCMVRDGHRPVRALLAGDVPFPAGRLEAGAGLDSLRVEQFGQVQHADRLSLAVQATADVHQTAGVG